MADTNDMKIDAYPSKEFFIDMLTKDISLKECILDLLDNSIHSFVRHEDLDVASSLFQGKIPKMKAKASISIECRPNKFSIIDTCGGISIKEARHQVFLFGKPQPDPTHAGLGVYGIGMKRAMFKIGDVIDVKSNTTEDDFRMTVNVKNWRKDPAKWEFEFTETNKRKHKAGGTTLEITALHSPVSKYFSAQSFQNELRDRIATTYALFIKGGVEIELNGKLIEADLPTLGETKGLKSVRHETEYDGVDILITAGITPREDRTPRGWYVFCNGRLVLDADKTKDTGWGMYHVPTFQPKYNHFLGMVHLRCKDVRKLPWTTTKEEVEQESPVYQHALVEMRSVTRGVLDFLNSLYPDTTVEAEAEREMFDRAKPTEIQKVAGRSNTMFKAEVKAKKDSDLVSIQYRRPRKKLDQIRKILGREQMSNVAVGEYTFDIFLKRNS
ncbi:MAG TPA: ATP-binding protein [Planctomycetaceae bacterium]|jgi:hypothetical protein